MSNCPCCSHTILRHIRTHQVYWFCRNCWQEMPNIELLRSTSLSNTVGHTEFQACGEGVRLAGKSRNTAARKRRSVKQESPLTASA